MGCKFTKDSNKRTATVQPMNEATGEHRRDNTRIENDFVVTSTVSYILASTKSKPESKRSIQRRMSGSDDSLGGSCSVPTVDDLDDRGQSASSRGSKFSKQSSDSGIEAGNSRIITEYSDKHLVDDVEGTFEEKAGLVLEIAGIKCKPRLSAKQKALLEEERVVKSLRDQGLVPTWKGQSSGGISFEIAEENPGIQMPPSRLIKVEKVALTEEEIRAKLERAEKRRRKKEKEKVKKIRALEEAAKETYAQILKAREEEQSHKMTKEAQMMSEAYDNREKRLKDIRDKLREKERRAQEVRKRKQLNLDGMTPEPNEAEFRANAAF